MNFPAHLPSGPLESKWDRHKFSLPLVSPAGKRKLKIIVVGSGLAGASAAASLAELGYQVKVFCLQDSPRRAHSIAAQGGINAAKNYPGDGDSIKRLFYDTIKGGDFRSREANVYRLAQISNQIIDQAVAQGVPFAREYGGLLANRSFGGALVSRTFYARGQTGQQLLLGAYGALMRQAGLGQVELLARREMLDLVLCGGQAVGVTARNLLTGELESHASSAVVLASGGYGNVFYLSTNAMHSNVTAAWRCHKKGAYFANPCFTQIHPTCIPRSGAHQSKLTLLSESLRNDGRVWVSKQKKDLRPPHQIPEGDRDYYLERIYPRFGNLVPRDLASRQAKFHVDKGFGAGGSEAVYLDFESAMNRLGQKTLSERYGNLFDMYEKITGENPYKTPMRIYPAVHYTMGGLWVDYNLESTIKGLFVLGEANFSDHGANRLGASALMQGLADGYFIIPSTIGGYLAGRQAPKKENQDKAFKESRETQAAGIEKLMAVQGNKSAGAFHRELGRILWDNVGMVRNEKGLKSALEKIRGLSQEFWDNICVPKGADSKNAELEKAGRLADFLELGELMVLDALARKESCGSHFREEYQTEEQEALRDDSNFCHVSLWEKTASHWLLHKEPLKFEEVTLIKRNYK